MSPQYEIALPRKQISRSSTSSCLKQTFLINIHQLTSHSRTPVRAVCYATLDPALDKASIFMHDLPPSSITASYNSEYLCIRKSSPQGIDTNYAAGSSLRAPNTSFVYKCNHKSVRRSPMATVPGGYTSRRPYSMTYATSNATAAAVVR